MKAQGQSNSNTKEFEKIKPKGSKRGLKGLLCFLLVLLFMSVSTVCLIFGAYLSSVNLQNSQLSVPPSAVNGTINSNDTYVKVDYLVQVCVYNDSRYELSTGIVISENGYVLTSDGLFKDVQSAQILILSNDGQLNRGVYVGGDKRTDIAVLKVEQRGMSYISLDPTVTVNTGDEILIGDCSQNESGLPVISQGVSSSDSVRVAVGDDYPVKALQFNTTTQIESSGGALLNSKGELVGMVASVSDVSSGIGYAVKVDVISSVIDDIINNGCVQEQVVLDFSFEFIGVARAKILGVNSGLNLLSVSNESDLFQFGFSESDTITHINGKQILYENDFYDVIEVTGDRSTINLTIMKSNGEERNVDIRLLTERGSNNFIS